MSYTLTSVTESVLRVEIFLHVLEKGDFPSIVEPATRVAMPRRTQEIQMSPLYGCTVIPCPLLVNRQKKLDPMCATTFPFLHHTRTLTI